MFPLFLLTPQEKDKVLDFTCNSGEVQYLAQYFINIFYLFIFFRLYQKPKHKQNCIIIRLLTVILCLKWKTINPLFHSTKARNFLFVTSFTDKA